MNALVALCHFCELHGPRTLFCTEALHPPSPSPPSQAGSLVPGDRDRDGDREGEGLTMRANSSASQRGEMCEVSSLLLFVLLAKVFDFFLVSTFNLSHRGVDLYLHLIRVLLVLMMKLEYVS